MDTTSVTKDRRRFRRAELDVPVVIKAPDPRRAKVMEATAQLKNLSLAGVYFETEDGGAYHISDEVTISVSIPEAQRRTFPFTRLAGRCRVVRVQELPATEATARKRAGVALEFGSDSTALTASPPWG